MEIDGLRSLTDAVVVAFRQLRDALQIREAIITFLESPPSLLSAAEYAERAISFVNRSVLPKVENALSTPDETTACILATVKAIAATEDMQTFIGNEIDSTFRKELVNWQEQAKLPKRSLPEFVRMDSEQGDRLGLLLGQYCRQYLARRIVAASVPGRKKRRASDENALKMIYLRIGIECKGEELIFKWDPWTIVLSSLGNELCAAIRAVESNGMAEISPRVPPLCLSGWEGVLASLHSDFWSLWSQHTLGGGFSRDRDSDAAEQALRFIDVQAMSSRRPALRTLLESLDANERVEWFTHERKKLALLRQVSEKTFAELMDFTGGDVRIDHA